MTYECPAATVSFVNLIHLPTLFIDKLLQVSLLTALTGKKIPKIKVP